MTDPRFYTRKGPFSLEALADLSQSDLKRGRGDLHIEDVAPLDLAEGPVISVFNNLKYLHTLTATRGAACVLTEEMASKAPDHLALLISKTPTRAFALIAQAFYPPLSPDESLDPTALIHPSAKLGKGVKIGPFACIGENVELGDHVQVGPYTVIERGVVVGENTVIGPHVSLSYSLVGKNVHIKAGARIGQQGFGFFMDAGDKGGYLAVPQLGRVLIEDNVEIGANSTVDRGSGGDTLIGQGTRIDNLVQVAHNVHFGKGCVMVAQTGVAGSTKFGDYVAAGGQAGFADHLKIGSGARIAAKGGIYRDVAPGEVLAGSPAQPLKDHYRQVATLKKLAEQNRKKI